jgi:hypothetical protein
VLFNCVSLCKREETSFAFRTGDNILKIVKKNVLKHKEVEPKQVVALPIKEFI